MGRGKPPWITLAELLAYGSLVLEGNPVRLTARIHNAAHSASAHARLVDRTANLAQEIDPSIRLAPSSARG